MRSPPTPPSCLVFFLLFSSLRRLVVVCWFFFQISNKVTARLVAATYAATIRHRDAFADHRDGFYWRVCTMALFNFLVSCRLFVVLFLLLDFPHGLHADKTRLKKYKRVTRKLTESFRSCGLRVRGEGSSAKDSLSDVFADYEWESINKKSLKRPLVAAVYGQKNYDSLSAQSQQCVLRHRKMP